MSEIGVCTYCLKTAPLTRDHVPPKLLFPKPRPSDLVTVPACEECNNGATLDDAYFRLKVSLREGAGEHPDSEVIWKRALEGLTEPEQAGFLELFRNDLREGSKSHPHGVTVDTPRILRVASRSARGLFFHEVGRRLPAHYTAMPIVDERLPHAESIVQQHAANASAMLRHSGKTIGTIFEYAYQLFEEDEFAAFWAMRFYADTFFMVIMGPTTNFQPGLEPACFPYRR